MLLVDPEQIKQVLINVLINAIQAQTEGGSIAIRGRAESGDWITSVQDAGPGISGEQLERIFDPFFTTKREGTGLGLSISYQLVKNNGGRIRATSKPGQGACFISHFRLLINHETHENREGIIDPFRFVYFVVTFRFWGC